MAVTEQRVSEIESIMAELARAQVRTDMALRHLAESQAKTEQELREFKAEMAESRRRSETGMAEFKREAEADRKRMDKAWGDLANRLGTILEDIAAPNVRRIAEEELGMRPLIELACGKERQRPDGQWSEWDVMAVGHEAVLCCEVRSKLTRSGTQELLEKFASFPGFFPEYAALRLIKMVASWSVQQPVLEELTRQRIYAAAISGLTMELLNRDAF